MAIFHRPELALQLAERLLRPTTLDLGVRSGLFISGIRRVGKTTFLRQDLIPALENLGAVVIYVDLWSDTGADPAKLIVDAVRAALRDLESPTSKAVATLGRVKKLTLGGAGFSFGLEIDRVAADGGPTLSEVFQKVVDTVRTDVVLIVDEVQQAIAGESAKKVLEALKAARDGVNLRDGTPGHFLFIGTGSHRARVAEMIVRRQQAFQGADSMQYPLLGRDYVEFVMADVRSGPTAHVLWPDLNTLTQAFAELGHRPEEFRKALRQLANLLPTNNTESVRLLSAVVSGLRESAAAAEFVSLETRGLLAKAIFDRIAASPAGTKGLFGADALKAYAEVLGREIGADEVQRTLNGMIDDNLVLRLDHGRYGVSDPFVQAVWRENRQADELGTPPPAVTNERTDSDE